MEARKRGVEVQVIVPGAYIDSETVRRASRAKWGELLEAGVEIYEYQPTMFHSRNRSCHYVRCIKSDSVRGASQLIPVT